MPIPNEAEVKETEETVEETETQDTVDPSTLSEEELDKLMTENDGETSETPAKEDESAKETETETDTSEEGETVSLSKAEHEKLIKQLKDKEDYIQQQGREKGELRKKLKEYGEEATKDDPPPKVDDFSTIEEWAEARDAWRDRQKANAETVERAERETFLSENKRRIQEAVPEVESMKDGMREVLIADGYPEATVNTFLSDMYEQNPSMVFMVSRRVQDRQKITALEKELDTWKAKHKGFVEKVEKASNSRKSVTSVPSKTGHEAKPISESQISSLSDKALEEALKEAE